MDGTGRSGEAANMVHLCTFGGHEGEQMSPGHVYVTLFGGTDLKRRTVTQRFMDEQHSNGRGNQRAAFFLTIFGAASVQSPTLASEYVELMQSIRVGTITLKQWDDFASRYSLDRIDAGSFTLFGGFGAEEPSQDAELDDLAMHRHLGQIPDAAAGVLMLAIGQKGKARSLAVRTAVEAALSGAGQAIR
jgi:hypothetical protein